MCVIRVGLGQPLGNGEAVAIILKRAREIALRLKHVADPLIGDEEAALPFGVAGIGLDQALHDRKAVLIRLECCSGVALLLEHGTDLVVGNGKVALPDRIVRV